MQNIIFIDPLR